MITRDDVVSGVATETSLFLGRRLRKLRTHISGVLNVNPFLMCLLQDFHAIHDQKSLAEFMLGWHLGNGHATGFGIMIDEKVLPNVFRTVRLDTAIRDKPPYSTPPFDDIDHLVTRHDGHHLLSLKASSWTIQYGQAMGLYRNFRELGEGGHSEAGIVVGVFYGHKGLLTDKYRIVRGLNTRRKDILEELPFVHVKAGQEFWSWLNDDQKDTQDWMIDGIQQGVDTFSKNNRHMGSVVGGGVDRLVAELRAKYKLPDGGSLDWHFLLHAINDDKGEEIGTEPIDPSLPETPEDD